MYGANNYGYNPYGTYMPQRPIQQPIQQEQMQPTQMSVPSKHSLNGKQVESIEVAKVQDIPLDGSISYFAITDGSAIVTKQLGMDGTSKTTIYKPITESKTIKYATFEDIEDIKVDIDSLKDELKDLKRSNKRRKIKNE